MSDEDLCFSTLHQLSEGVRRHKFSPVEVVETHLRRCERLNPLLNAFITLAAESALEAARQAEREIAAGNYRGPLHGIPIGLKDVFNTAGIRTTNGSSFYRDYVPKEDAAAVRTLRDAGAAIIGKCNLHEFAGGSTTNNPWYGAARNPWNLERSPGGSSGGSGAAVAAFLCPGATGTDTGGSIRGPAACNGIVGLKPTYGRVSLRGIFPNSWSLDTAGPIARTVRDAALLLGAMAGYDPEDPTSANVPVPNFTEEIEEGIRGLRLAFCPDLHVSEIDSSVADALRTVGLVLEDLGATVTTVAFPGKDIVRETGMVLNRAEFWSVHRERFTAERQGYGADLQASLDLAAQETAYSYVRACYNRKAMRRAFENVLREVDAILLPTAPCIAPWSADGLSEVNGRTVNFGEVGVPLRIPVNVLGVPSLAIAIGFHDGLPVSMQIVGAPWNEAKIIRIGHAYEVATPEIRQMRPLHS